MKENKFVTHEELGVERRLSSLEGSYRRYQRYFTAISAMILATIIELFRLFLDESSARIWFEGVLWEEGKFCEPCGSQGTSCIPKEKPMPYWCKSCRSYFSVKTGTPMQSSKISLRKWAIAINLMTTNLKGVSSMKLHRELGINQYRAWHMIHRVCENWDQDQIIRMSSAVEVDEIYIGSKEKNKRNVKKLKAGGGTVGQTAVVGAKERDSKKIIAKPVPKTDSDTLQDIISYNVEESSTVYTDDAKAYASADEFEHKSVRHNIRKLDTIDHMCYVIKNLQGKRLTYEELVS